MSKIESVILNVTFYGKVCSKVEDWCDNNLEGHVNVSAVDDTTSYQSLTLKKGATKWDFQLASDAILFSVTCAGTNTNK